jgi:peroxiredoxin
MIILNILFLTTLAQLNIPIQKDPPGTKLVIHAKHIKDHTTIRISNGEIGMKSISDSANIINGKATITIKNTNLNEVHLYYIPHLDSSTVVTPSFFLDSTVVNAYILPSPEKFRIVGGDYNRGQHYINQELKRISYLEEELNTIFQAYNNDSTILPKFILANKRYEDSLLQIKKTFMIKQPNSLYSLYLLQESITYNNLSNEDHGYIYNGLTNKLKQSNLGQSLGESIKKSELVQLGKQAPSFWGLNPQGDTIRLDKYKGQYVLLEFWASWCAPCRKETIHLKETFKNYQNKNFTILGISIDRNNKNWIQAIEEDKTTWDNIICPNSKTENIRDAYQVYAVPKNFLLDPTGKIIAMNLKQDSLTKFLEKIL